MKKLIKKKTVSFTLITVSILFLGFYFFSHKNQRGTPLVAVTKKDSRLPFKSSDAADDKGKGVNKKIEPQSDSDKKFNSIDEIAKHFTREELNLLSDCSRAKLDLRVVREFISKSKNFNNRADMLGLALLTGEENIRLKMELVRFTNKRFPDKAHTEFANKASSKKKHNSKNLYKLIKKDN